MSRCPLRISPKPGTQAGGKAFTRGFWLTTEPAAPGTKLDGASSTRNKIKGRERHGNTTRTCVRLAFDCSFSCSSHASACSAFRPDEVEFLSRQVPVQSYSPVCSQQSSAPGASWQESRKAERTTWSCGIEPQKPQPAETKKRMTVPHQENVGWSCPQFTRVFAPPTTAASFSCSVSSL